MSKVLTDQIEKRTGGNGPFSIGGSGGGDRDMVEAVIDGITMCVPINPDNRHYQAIQEWVAEGNTIEEAS